MHEDYCSPFAAVAAPTAPSRGAMPVALVSTTPTKAQLATKAKEDEYLEECAFTVACETLESRFRQAVWARTNARTGELKTLKNAFLKFDTDNSGTVDLEEFKRTLKHLGLHCNEGDTRNEAGCPTGLGGLDPKVVEALFSRYDADGGGSISYDEFSERFLKDVDMYKLPKML